MQTPRILVTTAALVGLLATVHPADARRASWKRCRQVCSGFAELCLEVCEEDFDPSARPLCRRACRQETIRRCKVALRGDGTCGDY